MKIIEESGITYTFLWSSAFMQNLVNYYGYNIESQNAIFLPARDGKVSSFVDVRDIAAVAAKVLLPENDSRGNQHENKTYVITGPEALSYSQAAEIISNQSVGKYRISIP